ncbi:NAD-dependent succinate-semialdehyde dehydrogenase [Actinoplanes sp. NPDC089786]|uniref:NAD-dependent succinate-semialdehyde dehydrogenase n=1 Tax=Actinoplanes sp. NPDC089786 TaxID=3155185 RepID=UPI0034454068
MTATDTALEQTSPLSATTGVGPRDLVDAVPHELFIGGQWVPAGDGATLGVENPATGQRLCEVSDASAADGLRALDAAVAAQEAWAATAPRERADILMRAYHTMMADTEPLARLLTLEMGKSVAESRGEVRYAADYLRWFGEEVPRIAGAWRINGPGDGRIITMQQPVGPCLLVTPWNAPLALATRKIGPALAAGCTAVVKPAAQTPLNTLYLADVFARAGLPAGVLNVVTTTNAAGLTGPLLADDRLRKVSFTGSTPVGKLLLEQAAGNVLRTSMELGGNAPFVVCQDADLDVAVSAALTAKMRNIGEACIAANRFFVHATVADEFVARLTAEMAALRVGDGSEPGVNVGPLIDGRQRARLGALVDEAVAGGANLHIGGYIDAQPGYFYPPTILTDVPDDARIRQEEIFGPVAVVNTFTDEQAVMQAANDTPYGLVGYVFTRDLSRGVRLVEQLQTGMVGLNRGFVSDATAPFGGVKQSGTGREGGFEGIREYLETKYVALGL